MNNQSTKAKELMNEPHLMNSLHQSIRLKEFSHHLTQSVFIGIPDELQSEWLGQYSRNDGWLVYSVADIDELVGGAKVFMLVDLVLLYIPFTEFQELSGKFIKVKKKFPNAFIVILSEGCDPTSIQQSFFLGASGYLLTKESVAKSFGRLNALLTKQLPAVSEKLIPYMVEALKGPSTQAALRKPLSELQLAVAKLLVKGLSYEEIASTLQKNLDTVRYHVKKIYQKYNISRRMQLIHLFQESGM
ncbi:MAG: response regulator transcription factor [Saprospiraceae bacterium]|jgi:DNA-binding NarL/FixJ family response regulator|nr:response regulator transcription factor [Saprospiraceae bacterium]